MNKYGVEHFHIELLEETDSPEERECFWIEQKGSFKNGYNATMGGDGKKYIDYDLVVATYKEMLIMKRVAEQLGISEDSVSRILQIRQVETLDASQAAVLATGKIVNQYDLNNNFIQSFPSSKAAAESLGKITSSSNGASSHISDVCRGKRKTAYGFIWRFAE
jgi:hypothetical protein